MTNTWAWIYGDECDFLWNHFGLKNRDSKDRIKIKFLEYELADEFANRLVSKAKDDE